MLFASVAVLLLSTLSALALPTHGSDSQAPLAPADGAEEQPSEFSGKFTIHPNGLPDKCLYIAKLEVRAPAVIRDCDYADPKMYWEMNRDGLTHMGAAKTDAHPHELCLSSGMRGRSWVPLSGRNAELGYCALTSAYPVPQGNGVTWSFAFGRLKLTGSDLCLDRIGMRAQTWLCDNDNVNQIWTVTRH